MPQLYLVGLGLNDEKDITVRGLECVKSCDFVYLESYTSVLLTDKKENLEQFYNKQITLCDRIHVEECCDEIINAAKVSSVAFLVVGDPFCATTHADLVLRATEAGVKVVVIHNASIMNAVAECGLSLYSFGETVSIPFFTESWKPDSFYHKLKRNRDAGLHTLCLLDIKVKEKSLYNLMKGIEIFEPPRFMTINVAIDQLFQIEDRINEGACSRDVKAFGIARIGDSESQKILSGTLQQLLSADFGPPLHSLVICAKNLTDIEDKFYALKKTKEVENEVDVTQNVDKEANVHTNGEKYIAISPVAMYIK